MTTTQLEAFTDVQAVAVTTDQRAAMTAAQTALLDAAVSGEQEQEPEVTASPPPPPPSMGRNSFHNSSRIILYHKTRCNVKKRFHCLSVFRWC